MSKAKKTETKPEKPKRHTVHMTEKQLRMHYQSELIFNALKKAKETRAAQTRFRDDVNQANYDLRMAAEAELDKLLEAVEIALERNSNEY